MAVQAQYPSHVLLLNRDQPELNKEMEFPQSPPGFFNQSGTIFLSNGGERSNTRKRGRKAPPPPPAPSTGLRLAFDGQNHSNPIFSSSSSSISEDLAAPISQQKDEIDRFLIAQGENLRRALTEKLQRHYREILAAAEAAATRRLKEKQAEVERAAKRGADLEERLARLRTESMAWQAKAMTDQATAAALHAQIQVAVAAAPPNGEEGCGESPDADDAGSAHVDPNRVELERACRSCRGRPASVVLLPCRHLSLCSGCDAAGKDCPVCRSNRTGSVQVFF